jgi:hypothetical protein
MPRFIRNHPIWFVLLALLLAYGLWWLYQDYELRTYPQQVAAILPIPPGVEVVYTASNYSRKCKSSSAVQYFTTNETWNTIVDFYNAHLQEPWQMRGSGQIFEQFPAVYSRASIQLHQIDITMAEEYEQEPRLRQKLLGGVTPYLIQIAYNQDLRLCRSED